MYRYLILFACLLAAVLSYVVGINEGIILFVGAGMVFEAIFWLKLLKPQH